MSRCMKPLRGLESHGLLEHLNTSAEAPGNSRTRAIREKMADNIQAVNDANFQTDVIEASKTQPVMVDFWADWCRPCHMLSPTVEEIARENAGKPKAGKLDGDENSTAAGRFT